MSKVLYVGVGDKCRKVAKGYLGISNKARRVKKMYIGDANGKARQFFQSPLLKLKGAITALSEGRSEMGSATVGNYCLFAGGENSSTGTTTLVETYNKSLVRSTATGLATLKYSPGSGSNGSYAIFAGGQSDYGALKDVDAYNASLTKTRPADLRAYSTGLTGTGIGQYVLFAGGLNSNGSYADLVNVDTYNRSLTKGVATNLSAARSGLSAASNGTHACIMGGSATNSSTWETTFPTNVDAYNTSLTRTSHTGISVGREKGAAGCTGNYILFAGGQLSNYSASNAVDAYNRSLTRSTTTMSIGRMEMTGTSNGGFALFAGNTNQSVEIFNDKLVRTVMSCPSGLHQLGSAGYVGDYMLVAGGVIFDGDLVFKNGVDAYSVC